MLSDFQTTPCSEDDRLCASITYLVDKALQVHKGQHAVAPIKRIKEPVPVARYDPLRSNYRDGLCRVIGAVPPTDGAQAEHISLGIGEGLWDKVRGIDMDDLESSELNQPV